MGKARGRLKSVTEATTFFNGLACTPDRDLQDALGYWQALRSRPVDEEQLMLIQQIIDSICAVMAVRRLLRA